MNTIPLEGIDLREARDRQRTESHCPGLLESAADAMVIVNQKGRIVLANSQAVRMFCYPRNELVGQFVELLFPKRLQIDHIAHSYACFQAPSTPPMDGSQQLCGLRKDGVEFPVEITLNPLETTERILVIRDVTERRRAEDAIQRKNMKLEKANQSKDRFLATMSHELRTPLNAIIGFTGTLLMKLPGPLNEEQEDQLQTVERSANQLLSLINDLLDLARIESGNLELHLEPVPCWRVIEEVVDALKPMAEQKHLELTSFVSDRDALVRTDRRAFQQILLNLTTNALKFTKQGGVHIELRQKLDRGLVTEISVTDTGVGIRKEDQHQLFHAFQQMQRKGRGVQQGIGLGLHISQKLAKLLGGRIVFHSDVGKGSTFTLAIREKQLGCKSPMH